jgi:YD repeat-containing protein
MKPKMIILTLTLAAGLQLVSAAASWGQFRIRGVPLHRSGINLYSPHGQYVHDHFDNYHYVVPSTPQYGAYYTYDNTHGLLTQTRDAIRDEVDEIDLRCTRFSYAHNESKWLIGLPSETTVATTCSSGPGNDALISKTWTSYDGRAHGETPTKGNPTKQEAWQYIAGSPANVSRVTTSETTYDSYGRVTETKDALGRATRTEYFPETGRPTRMTVTNALEHTTTTLLDVRRGQATTIQEPNGRKTELAYDPLGRLVKVWLPGLVDGMVSAGTTPGRSRTTSPLLPLRQLLHPLMLQALTR